MTYSGRSSHRICMTFDQSQVTFSFYLIGCSLLSKKKIKKLLLTYCWSDTRERMLNVYTNKPPCIWISNSYIKMIAIKWEMGLTGMHDFNLGAFIVKHIVRGIIYCWKDITWGIVSQRFSLRGTFFACHWHRTGKKSRVAVKNPTTDLWGHGYSEFVHCLLFVKICFYFSFTLFTHKNFSLCLQSFPSLPCWAQSLVWSQQVCFFTQAFRGLSNNKVLSLFKRTSFRTKGLISSQKETDLMVMRLLKHNP